MRITIREVARLAGVSATTVSNVLNGRGSVSEKTRKRVLLAVEALGYEQNLVARSLKTRKSRVIGVIISDNSNPLFSLVVRGIEEVASSEGYSVILCNTDQDVEREYRQIRTLNERQVDGMIISVADEKAEHLDLFRGSRPVVFVNRCPERLYGDVVMTDNSRGTREAVAHLLSLGHRRIGIVGCSPKYSTGRGRLEGYLAALKERGIDPDESLIVKATVVNRHEGFAAACTLLQQPSPPSAIIGATYYATVGLLEAIRYFGLAIPKDISVVGFDDPDWSECFSPPLTAVAQSAIEMGTVAAGRLIQRIEQGRDGPFEVIHIPPVLKIRSSCARA
jgi:LacI family transcriptional regulator